MSALDKKVVSITSGKQAILGKMNPKALAGNGSRKTKNMVSDVLNLTGGSDKYLAEKCELHVTTIKRMRECDEAYRPIGNTQDKIIQNCGFYLELKKR